MDALTVPDPSTRRREAGDFLRSRRELLRPIDVGLPAGVRRRTPGLRRDEVAVLAGVGTTWYTWLEQGRDVRPSDATLSALARALRLDATERRHLFLLHDRPPPERRPADAERVGAPLRRMLDSLTEQPAFVLGRRRDILAWNPAADAVFGPYERLEGEACNALHLMFADPHHRRLLVDWEAAARVALAMFRAESAQHAGDPDFERLVARLRHLSPEFACWWPKREVILPLAGLKRIDHPGCGRMLFEYASFAVDAAPGMKLIAFTPMEDDDTIPKLRRLLRARSGPGATADATTASPAAG